MARLLRGEIRRVTIEPTSEVIGHEQGNSRPALILSNDHFNDATELVIVALITSSPPEERKSILPSDPVGEYAEALLDSHRPDQNAGRRPDR